MLADFLQPETLFVIHASEVRGPYTHIVVVIPAADEGGVRFETVALNGEEVVVVIAFAAHQGIDERLAHVIVHG